MIVGLIVAVDWGVKKGVGVSFEGGVKGGEGEGIPSRTRRADVGPIRCMTGGGGKGAP